MRTLVIPKDTTFFASCDWGFNAPGVLLFWAHVGDGHWHIVREIKFQQETAETVAGRYHAMRKSLGSPRITYVAADPSMWAKTGHGRGESIAETLIRRGVPMVKGDNDRKNGWQRCHELLRLAPDGLPWLTFDVSCTYLCRSFPAQMSARNDPDDVNTNGDDHAADALRYGAMSRFVARKAKVPTPPPMYSPAWFKAQETSGEGVLARRSA